MSATPRFTPVLVYSDIEAAHTFLVDTFGFEAGSLPARGMARSSTARSTSTVRASGSTGRPRTTA